MDLTQVVAVSGEVAALFYQAMIAILSAMLSYFLNYLMEDHPVGRWYLSQLQTLPVNLAKPLGECPYCSAGWQYLAISIIGFDSPFPICFLFLGLNFFVIRKLIPPVK